MEALLGTLSTVFVVYCIWSALERIGEELTERESRRMKERNEQLRSPERDIVREARLWSEGRDRYGHGR
jgi:hypothetical protein